MQKITPFFWFDAQAEEAVKFYVDVFNGNPGKKKESKITATMRHNEESARASDLPVGSVLTVSFELEGQQFTALNGGKPDTFKVQFNGATSFVISCKTQAEVDHFWDKLSAGGEAGQCGWINHDKYGITWQIIPDVLFECIGGKDPEGADRAMKAMMGMEKLDIAALKAAYDGK